MTSNPLLDFILNAYHRVIPVRIDREINRALSISQEDFPRSVAIPTKYGRGMTERVVELFLARLMYRAGRNILDVGYANSTDAHLRMLKSLPEPVNITGIDLVPSSESVGRLYKHTVVGSITNTEYKNDTFDLIWCISALEHFGMNNSVYTSQFTLDTNMDAKALEEMMRILRIGGTLFISVPYGRFENHGWFRNYDKTHWQTLLEVARPTSRVDELYFRYSDADGWRTAFPEELAGTGYSDNQNSGASGLAVAFIHKKE